MKRAYSARSLAPEGHQVGHLASAGHTGPSRLRDIFRSNIKGGTELGKLAQSYTSTGRLVPDEVTNDMVADRLAQDDVAPGFLLDGYPRNAAQVDALDATLAASGTPLDAVVLITADTGRLACCCSSGPRSRAVRTTTRTPGPAPPGGLRRRDRAIDRHLRRPRAGAGSTGWVRSARSPTGCSPP